MNNQIIRTLIGSALLTVVLSAPGGTSYGSSQAEGLGPSSRRTPLVISEIMYHPVTREDGLDGEYLEIYNSQPWDEDLGGYRIEGAVDYEFLELTIIPAKGFLVVAKSPDALREIHGLDSPLGPYSGRLNNGGDTVRLLNPAGAILLEVPYDNETPWPIAADGAGHALVLSRPSYHESDPRAWSIGKRIGGSPGVFEPDEEASHRLVFINEIYSPQGRPGEAFVELINLESHPVDLSGARLMFGPNSVDISLPAGSVMESGDRLVIRDVVPEAGLQQAFTAVHLLSPDGSQVIDSTLYSPNEFGISYGRFPEGGERFLPLNPPSPGGPNSQPVIPIVIFNEIMFHPISDESSDEYLELYNRSGEPVDLSHWRITGGVRFAFPQGSIIPGNGYLVVAKDLERIRNIHAHLNDSNSTGPFRGQLSNQGERIQLSKPFEVEPAEEGADDANELAMILVDEVSYSDRSRFSRWADGGGSSLELMDPRSDNDFMANWADSDESKKSEWTNLDFTGDLFPEPGLTPKSLQIQLLGAGECLVDDVELLQLSSSNRIRDGNFEAGQGGWVFQGNHIRSEIIEPVGSGGGQSLILRASGRGDPHSNRIRFTMPGSGLRVPGQATIRSRIRWLRGHPEILFRLQGNFIEAFHRMEVPLNLGTPGRRNSRWVENRGPAIRDVRHAPVVPRLGESVVVTAHLTDQDGVGKVFLSYRVDLSNQEVIRLLMTDDGLESDKISGDGVYTAILPGPDSGRVVAFSIEAEDAVENPALSRYPSAEGGGECVVRFGDPVASGQFGNYRIWYTRDTLNQWTSRSRTPASNEPLDVTFVHNDERVFYNVGAYYSGSFFNSRNFTGPTGNACDYTISFRGMKNSSGLPESFFPGPA